MQHTKITFRNSLLVVALGMIMGITGCKSNDSTTNASSTSGTGTPPAANTVTIQNMAFNPATVTVAAGTTVTWTNNDAMTHTVTSGVPGSPDGAFDSGNMANGATYQHTFATKGTFQYYCKVHPGSMKATMVVQ
jgi:manganese oxidase